MIDATEAHADDKHDRQIEFSRKVQHVGAVIERDEHAAGALDYDDFGLKGEALPCRRDDIEFNPDANVAGGNVWRDRRHEPVRIAVAQREAESIGGRERGDISVARGTRGNARGNGLHAHDADAARGQCPNQCDGDEGLADTGIGAGNENSGCIRRDRGLLHQR